MRPGVLYFALFVILAGQGRFMSLVLTDSLRLRESEAGWVLGFGILSGLFSMPFWSMRADTKEIGCKRVLMEMVVLHLLAFSLLPLGRMWFLSTSHDGVYVMALLSRFFSAALISPCNSVLDAYTLRVLEDKDQYGKERLFGAVSWALANILMGVFMDSGVVDPLWVCGGFLLAGTIMFIGLLWKCLPSDGGDNHANVTVVQEPPSLTGFLNILHLPGMLFFMLVVTLVMGCATSLVEHLLFLFMRTQLQASYTLCGVSVVVTVLFEIPLFFVGKPLLLRVGVLWLLVGAMVCYITRVVVYTLVSNGWAVLLVEPLHGVTYAMLQTASVAFVHSKCPSQQTAQGQGLLNVFKNSGALLGTVVGSRILQYLGSGILFRGMALIVTTSLCVLVLARHKALL
ncbi:hypothetical protein BASA81_008278 [Batrachochytrium salamandrivorans]|nr:hypothetical protein BASA81_008278 [Batrachochytrium salamandrivorans]